MKGIAEEGKNETLWLPTEAEERLLDALLDPASRMLSVLDICRKAKVGKDTYYRAFAKPEFRALYHKCSLELISHKVAPVVNALVKEASRGSAPHIKMALEIAGIYVEKQEVVTETYAERLKRLHGEG